MTLREPQMTDRQRFYFAAVLSLLALAMVAVTCCSCRPSSAPRIVPAEPAPEHLRTPEQQVRWAVQIDMTCPAPAGLATGSPRGLGTGVVTSRRHVVTAHHVVANRTCDYEAVEADGTRHPLAFDGDDAEHDQTRMVALIPFAEDVPPVDIGPVPQVGALVCAVGRLPWTTRLCGFVQPAQRLPGENSDVVHQVITQPGNSGGPLYDARGRLVAVTTRYWTCMNGQLCGGAASSLYLRPWMASDDPAPR